MERKTKRRLLALCGLGMIAGCDRTHDYTEQEYSQTLVEDATVVQTVYCPGRHGSGSSTAPTVTLSSDGNVGMGATFVNVDVKLPEKYAVVFRCDHGKFIIEGEDEDHKSLWKRLNEGEKVVVSYREIYTVTYRHQKGTPKDRDEVVKRELVDYDFLDAQKKE